MPKSGDHVVCGDDCTAKRRVPLLRLMADFGWIHNIDTTEPKNVDRANRKNTRMVYVETPTNP